MNKESLFNAFKKFTEEVTNSSEKLFKKVADTLNDESETHKAALTLSNKIQGSLKTYKGKVDPQVKQQIEDFLADLNSVLEQDSESPTSKYPVDQLALAEICMRILASSKSHLEADPELWKLFKAPVSAYLEGIIGIINTLEKEHTEYSNDKGFVEHKKNIMDLKDKIGK